MEYKIVFCVFFASGRLLMWILSVGLVVYIGPMFDDMVKHPLPLNVPHRGEIYMGQGFWAVFVREALGAAACIMIVLIDDR